jgi:hypothetical protein
MHHAGVPPSLKRGYPEGIATSLPISTAPRRGMLLLLLAIKAANMRLGIGPEG